MSPTDYKQRHPIAWIVLGAAILLGAGYAASMSGLLPFGPQPVKVVCSECGVVEAVRTVETPMAPPGTALEQSVTDAATAATAPAGPAGAEPSAADAAAATQVSFSYETTIRYENGTTGVFNQAEPPSWAPGDRVKVVDGLIVQQAS